MDSKIIFSSSSTPLSLVLSYPSLKPRLSVKTHVSISLNNTSKSQFLGQSLEKKIGFLSLRKPQFRQVITAVVKRRKELPFDNVIQREKKLKLVLKIRKILTGQPDRIMSLRDLGRYRRELGLTRKRRFIALLKRFPGVFEIVEEGCFSLRFRLTPEADRIYLEELKVRNEMEGLLVIKLRKLLMMSLEKRVLIEKITHLKADFGLPTEFRDTICNRYPQYFRVVDTERGPALELTHWDPELAISAAEIAAEENEAREIEERNLIIDRTPKFNKVKLPKGLNLSKGELRRILKFKEVPYISPYADFSGLKAGTIEKERHACAVIHEMLSFCVEKRTLVDHLTHFREEFRFSQQLRGMLIRHPDMFYVSLKGERDSVFLREAYRDSQLIEKDRLLLIKEKLRSLVAVPRFTKRGGRRVDKGDGDEDEDEEDSEEDEEGEEDWSDVDNLLANEDDDNDDDWSDEEDDDETPPDFDDGDGNVSLGKIRQVERRNTDDKPLEPMYPDGRARERW
ncbi:protein WHAT'S THIS FACTOR 1 homolog [Papaver somniferum]|uniref:protein WHAT'S THIS FACTOR 1 homolog n=1 Tax=Papaver somniferum TaxID=3469 RepID=UPI000E702146|nr:protein WHAT'S THIS FACTOR 1 homolog [Papaver somniferum]